MQREPNQIVHHGVAIIVLTVQKLLPRPILSRTRFVLNDSLHSKQPSPTPSSIVNRLIVRLLTVEFDQSPRPILVISSERICGLILYILVNLIAVDI